MKTCVTKNWDTIFFFFNFQKEISFKKKSFDFTHMVIYDIIFFLCRNNPYLKKKYLGMASGED